MITKHPQKRIFYGAKTLEVDEEIAEFITELLRLEFNPISSCQDGGCECCNTILPGFVQLYISEQGAMNLVDQKKMMVEKPDPFPAKYRFRVFMSLTEGELLALVNAAETYAKHSVVGKDVFAYLQNALEESKIKLGF